MDRNITIPWYTLRSKKEFFDTVAHESSHVSAYQEKFDSKEKKIFTQFRQMLEEFNNLPDLVKYSSVRDGYVKKALDYYWKHKKIIDTYGSKGWAHGVNYFYPAYQDCFNSLITSPCVSYNYNNSSSPKSFNEVRDYGKDYD